VAIRSAILATAWLLVKM